METERTTGMKCPACGAKMHLIGMAPDKKMMAPGYEEHTFEYSGCHARVERRVFIPRAIGPLTSQQMPLPLGRIKRETEGTSAKWRRVGALGYIARGNVTYIAGTLIIVGLAGSILTWGEAAKGPMGDQGPPGAKGPTGDPGPAGAASGIRILRFNCDETACRVQCGESEMLLTAYCGPKRNAAIIATERAATCRAAGPANNHLVAVCAQIAP